MMVLQRKQTVRTRDVLQLVEITKGRRLYGESGYGFERNRVISLSCHALEQMADGRAVGGIDLRQGRRFLQRVHMTVRRESSLSFLDLIATLPVIKGVSMHKASIYVIC